MEEAGKSQMRGKARSDGMMMLVQRVDLEVAQELYDWNETNRFLSLPILPPVRQATTPHARFG